MRTNWISEHRICAGISWPPRIVGLTLGIFLSAQAIAEDTKNVADHLSDPLPAGAQGRLGTIRFRHGDQINAVAYSPDGNILATGGQDGAFALWNAESGAEMRWWQGRGSVFALTFSPDGKMLAVGGRAKIIGVYEVVSGKELYTCTGHEGPVLALRSRLMAACSPRGARTRTCSSGTPDPGKGCAPRADMTPT